MPDYAGIKAELALPAYAKMDDEAIAAAWEAPLAVVVDVPVGTVEGYLRSHVLMSGIKRFLAAIPANTPVEFTDGLSELMGMLASPHVDTVIMTKADVAAEVRQILGGAVAFGLMKQQNMDELLALSVVLTTRAAQLGLSADVHDTVNEIAAARIWPGVSE